MPRSKKFYAWLAGAAGGPTVFLIATALLLPMMIDLGMIKEKILTEVAEQLGAHAHLERLSLVFFPRPHVIVSHMRLSIPGEFSGTADSITIYPRMIPLFSGKMQVSRLLIDRPLITANLPQIPLLHDQQGTVLAPSPGSERQTPALSEDLEQKVISLLGMAASRMPRLVLVVNDGQVTLQKGDEDLFWFRNIRARIVMPPDKLEVNLSLESNLCGGVFLNGAADVKSLSSKGRMVLSDLRPGLLAETLIPSWSQRFGDSLFHLDMAFSSSGPADLQAEFSGSVPALAIRRSDEEYVIKSDAFAGTCQVSGEKLSVSVSKMRLDYPRLDLTGSFEMDPRAPSAGLVIESRDTDADAVRKVSLALAGESPTVRRIFDVVRGGRVPFISFNAHAGRPADLGKSQNFVIKGSMVQGKIFVPKVQLDVEDAQGEVVIADGILEGRGLEGRTAGSYGRDCTLVIGLARKEGVPPPFHLDIDIDADIEELPPVLERVVKSKPFLRELALIRGVKGRARGRLILGENLNAVKTRVEVSQWNLKGHYQRLPHVADLKGRSFFYEGTRVAVGGMDGVMGKSSFAGFDVAVDWGPQSLLQVQSSSQSQVSLDEAYPWFTSFDAMKKLRKNVESLKGILKVENVSLNGSLFRGAVHSLRMKGNVGDVVLQAPFFPAPVAIKKGRIDATPHALVLEAFNASLLDASASLSGSLGGYLEGLETTDLTFQGTAGPQFCQWVYDLIHLPSEFRPRPPLTVSRSHLVREKESKEGRDIKVFFSGDVGVPDGPEFSIDVAHSREKTSISRLTIKDQDSDAALSLSLKIPEMDLQFSGALGNATLNRLLLTNTLPKGWIKGSFRSRLLLDHFLNSTVTGEFQAGGFAVPFTQNEPITVEDAHVVPVGNSLSLKSAQVNWRGIPMVLQGDVDFSEEGYRLDLDLQAENLAWEKLKPGEEKKKNGGSTEIVGNDTGRKDTNTRDLPVRGVVRVHAKSFSHGKLTWLPLEAEVSLLDRNELKAKVLQANLCGISTPGVVRVSPKGVQLDLKVSASGQELDPALACLWNKSDLMRGPFTLNGELTTGPSWAVSGDLLKTLQGSLEFSASQGRIYRMGLLNKIFSVLNFTEIYRGHLPDLVDEGFAYDSIKAKGTVKDGKLSVDSFLIDAPSMRMAWRGSVDLEKKKLDFNILVAPLRTVDRIIGQVPVLSEILGGNLISFPVSVSGDIADAEVIPLSPSALGSEVLGYFKRTLQLPLGLLNPAP